MPERAITRGARRWETIPGVTYPAESAPKPDRAASRSEWGQDELPDAALWCSSTAAAEALHVSSSAVRIRLHKAGVPNCRARGVLYWERAAVAALAARRGTEALPPAEWR